MLHVAHNVLIGIAALWVSTLLHEWAHALFARLVGFQVLSVAFGTGRPVFDRTFFRSMRFTVGAVPGVGLTTFGSPTPMAHHKLRLAVAFLAGPLSHLPVVLLLWGRQDIWSPALLSEATVPAFAFFWCNALMLIINAAPMNWGGLFQSDGKQILALLTGARDEELRREKLAASFAVLRGFERTRIDDVEGALEIYEGALVIAPDDLMLRLNRSLVLIDLGQLPEAESKIAGFLDHADATDMTRAMCRNALAYYAAIKGHIGEARDQFNAMPEAIRRSPFIKGTWGIIDCLGGRPQSALRILKAAYNTSLTPAAAASYMGWLALCYIELGDVDKADKCLAKARPQFRGDVYSVKRAKARLAGGTDVAETEASNIADVTSNEGEGPVSDSHP